MRILTYEYRDVDEVRWHFSKVDFVKVNLLVGDTATGKTRLLNTIFNLGRFAAANEFKSGHFDVLFEHQGNTYRWVLESHGSDEDSEIVKEQVSIIDGTTKTILVERDEKSFWYNEKELPKLPINETSIWLLKEEEAIQPIHDAFSLILRRRFFHDAISKVSQYSPLPLDFDAKMVKKRELRELFRRDFDLNLTLYFLSKYFKDHFDSICNHYRAIFPFISNISVRDLGEFRPRFGTGGLIPVICFKEKEGAGEWIPISELSSGMQKVLLILTDSFVLPDGGVYIIDEYENSLGVSAIEFLPSFMLELEKEIQFFITSHHPYLINNIPVKNWYVFHRVGQEVTIKFGNELTERYGKSKQQAFIQLINDPFYAEGVE